MTTGIDMTADGSIYLIERNLGRIVLIAPNQEPRVLLPAPDYDNGLLRPGHLVVDSAAGRIYVSDPVLDEVAVFDMDGTRVATWPNIRGAAGIALNLDGDIVVAAGETGELILYSPDGFKLQSWRVVPPGGIDLLAGVDVGPDGKMYVVDGQAEQVFVLREDGSRDATIQVDLGGGLLFDIAVDQVPGASKPTRYWVATSAGLRFETLSGGGWKPTGSGPAWGVALHRDHGVVVTQPTSSLIGSKVLHFDLSPGNGIPLPTDRWGATLLRPGLLDGPERVVVGADDGIYLLDRGDRVQRFSPDGSDIRQLEPAGGPIAVAAGPNGWVYTSSSTQLTGYRTQGMTWNQAWRTPLALPMRTDIQAVSMVYDPAGDSLVVLNSLLNRLHRFSTAGVRGVEVGLRDVDPNAQWSDLTVDAAGTIYALDRANRRVHVVDASGQQRVVVLPDRARQIEAGPAGQLFTLDRDGWVRRYDVSGATGTLTAAFDATRFDRSQYTGPSDLALGAGGQVYVTDRAASLVSRFEWDPNASATPPPSDEARCRNYPDKTASPSLVNLGETVEVRLSVRGGCGSQVTGAARDIILILDVSGSMAAGDKITILREAALGFTADVDFTASRVGVVSFTTTATVEQALSRDADAVRRAIANIAVDPAGGTAIDQGLKEAYDHWFPRQQPNLPATFILLSDGGSNPALANIEANRAKTAGVEIFTISIQGVQDLMRSLATDDDHFFEVDNARFLYGVFEQIADRITPATLFESITVTDDIPADMVYVTNSAVPPASFDAGANRLTWTLGGILPTGFVLSYRLEPQVAGDSLPTNIVAWGDFIDGFAQPGRLDFPIPRIQVVDRTPASPTPTLPLPTLTPNVTITPTPTPTLSPTPRPTVALGPIFIPIALNEAVCKPSERHADVMLVLDTSSSMTAEKLAAAKAAAKRFVQLLGLPADQAGVVGFNSQASLTSPLSTDRAALAAAIDGLSTAPGTRMDRGLEIALAELSTSRHRAENSPVVVLLTDGRQDEEPDRAIQVAALVRGSGIAIFAIGLGGDVDRDFLIRLAGGAGRTYLAPGPQDLARIYEQVAGQVPCPAEVYWGGR
jgi:Mg-chelatase subunit ChlD/sugar lactone lactonase YvrE